MARSSETPDSTNPTESIDRAFYYRNSKGDEVSVLGRLR
jgi:hypothetical protein